MSISFPAATDSVESLAEWLELEALRSGQEESSLEALVRVIRRGGTTDAEDSDQGDRGSEISQRVAQDAFSEVEERVVACGGEGYPFAVEPGLLRLRPGWQSSPYVFLLLVSQVPPTSGYKGTARLFERLCSHAARHYLGGSANGALSLHFGSPRKAPVVKLSQAIDHLCAQLGEGGGWARTPQDDHKGDEKLDLVAWRHFPDKRNGKLIVFGQCAGGKDWSQKVTDLLDGRSFAQKWFRRQLVVGPTRFYFVPRRILRDSWDDVGIDAGVLFDRCRIVACLVDLDTELTRECAAAICALMRRVLRE